jgi:hypothetical protein
VRRRDGHPIGARLPTAPIPILRNSRSSRLFAARIAVVSGDARQAKRAKPGRLLGIDLPPLILLAARRPSLVFPQLHPDQLRLDFEASAFDARLLQPRHRAVSFLGGAMPHFPARQSRMIFSPCRLSSPWRCRALEASNAQHFCGFRFRLVRMVGRRRGLGLIPFRRLRLRRRRSEIVIHENGLSVSRQELPLVIEVSREKRTSTIGK